MIYVVILTVPHLPLPPPDYRVGCYHKTEYKIVLTSDEEVFGGYKNLSKNNDATFVAEDQGINDRPHSFRVSCRLNALLVVIVFDG